MTFNRTLFPTAGGLLTLVFASFCGGPILGQGTLLIVGGGLDPANAEVYQSLLNVCDDASKIGIIPLASGVPEESGPLSVQDFQQYASRPDRIFDTELTYTNPALAADPKVAAQVGACGGLWFTGGDQSRIVEALRPVSGDTLGYQAVLDVLANGGVVGGSSAGAAMMSNPMIGSGESETAMLLGSTDQLDGPGVCLKKGMGLFPYGLSDQHFLQRGRFGRLLVALEATQMRLGFGISEDCALVVDLKTGRMKAIGEQAVTIIDTHDAHRQGHDRDNIRVHLLGDADTFDAKIQQVLPEEGKTEDGATSLSATPTSFSEPIWRRNAVGKILAMLSSTEFGSVVAADDAFDYVFIKDEKTKFYFHEKHGKRTMTAVNVRLDIKAHSDVAEKVSIEKAKFEPSPTH